MCVCVFWIYECKIFVFFVFTKNQKTLGNITVSSLTDSYGVKTPKNVAM